MTPLIDIFSPHNKVMNQHDIEVRVTTYNQQGELKKNGSKLLLKRELFNHFYQQASSVYRMIPKPWGFDQNNYQGTAFHIGHNLVLTNAHVLSREFDKLTRCGGFRLRDHQQRFIQCQKVHHCSKELDVCLIEMNSEHKHALEHGPSLKLYHMTEDYETNLQMILSAIGNSQTLGIHFGQGRGYSVVGSNLYFYAPIRPGNSGGPVLNEEGQVVAIVTRESMAKVGNDASKFYNIATTISSAVSNIRHALQHDAETLRKFNLAVVE